MYSYPVTKSSGFYSAVPGYTKAVAPYGKGKSYGKPYAKPYGKSKLYTKPYGKSKLYAKPYGKGYGKGYGYPGTKAGGYSSKVPSTTVVTSPYPWGI